MLNTSILSSTANLPSCSLFSFLRSPFQGWEGSHADLLSDSEEGLTEDEITAFTHRFGSHLDTTAVAGDAP